MHNILGIITARGGSKGIPGKNIKRLGGKSLISYTIEVAKQSKGITHLITSTDDEAIAAVAQEYGCEVPFLRPKELAKDTTPHLPVIEHGLDFMERKEGAKFDAVVTLQPTSPFRLPEDIDETINVLFQTGADSAVSICEVDGGSHPIKMKKFDGKFITPYVIPEREGRRRQDLEKVYKRSAAVYVTGRVTLKEKGQFFGDQVAAYEVSADRSIDIDTPKDWVVAEWMLQSLQAQGLFKS